MDRFRAHWVAGIAVHAIPYAVGTFIGMRVTFERKVRAEVAANLEDEVVEDYVTRWACDPETWAA